MRTIALCVALLYLKSTGRRGLYRIWIGTVAAYVPPPKQGPPTG
jgi:hypothetical protein